MIIFTSNKHKTFRRIKQNASDCVLRWFLLVEEYGISFEYLPGKKKIIADALSHIVIDSLKIQDKK
jgi:hypothetical protein